MSKVKALYHIVINTHKRAMTLSEEHCKELYNYLFGILKRKGCFVYRINGVENHIHLLVDLPSTLALADLMSVLKQSSSVWLKQNSDFPLFAGWGKEYYAFSVSDSHKGAVIDYIIGQKEHHRKVAFVDELKVIFQKNSMEWNDYIMQ